MTVFTVKLKTSHSEAGRVILMSQIPEAGPIVKMSVSTTLFHPGQPRKGSECAKLGFVL